MFLLHPSGETCCEFVTERPGCLVPGPTVGRDDHRTEIPKIQFLEVGPGRLGTVHPLCGAKLGKEPLGHGHDLVEGHLRTILLLGGLVLFAHLVAYRRDSAPQHLLGHRALLGGHLGQRCIAVGAART